MNRNRVVANQIFVSRANQNRLGIHVENLVSNSGVRSYEFEFRHLPEDGLYQPTLVDDRFDDMAEMIRQEVHARTHIGLTTRDHWLLTITPYVSNGRRPLQRTFRELNSITGPFLQLMYEQLLSSDETIDVIGMRINVSRVGSRGGSGGKSLVPVGLRGVGLSEHPKQAKFNGEIKEPCGLMAFFMNHASKRYLPDKFELLLQDCFELKELIGFSGDDTYMQLRDFDKVVNLEVFDNLRILIFTSNGVIEHISKGPKWQWRGSRDVKDEQSVEIFRDRVGKHYYWIKTITSAAFRARKSMFKKDEEAKCWRCYQRFHIDNFNAHVCEGIDAYQCSKCMKDFNDKKLFTLHTLTETLGWWCECCKVDAFYGRPCFEKHKEICKPVDEWKSKVLCYDCKRNYIQGEEHECKDFGACNNCRTLYTSKLDQKEHYCLVAKKNIFWDPCPGKGKSFKPHYFYDFETCRGLEFEINGEPVYQHEVMAWCTRLMIPDGEFKVYIEESKYIDKLEKLLQDAAYEYVNWGRVDDSIRIWGREIQTFIQVCENILSHKAFPTFWAHNGSKFDSKFILDYYLNECNVDMFGEEYMQVETEPDGSGGWKEVKQKRKKKKTAMFASIVGSKILSMKILNMTFWDSCCHHPTALRELPKRFGLELNVKKGEFPYIRLLRENWGKIFPPPKLEEYNVDAMPAKRRKEVINWFNAKEDVCWDFDDELWDYLFADVDVGAKCMEAYHQSSLELHETIWADNPEMEGKHCSPLLSSTCASWAFNMFRTWFMPEIAVLKPAATRFIRNCLRGGRTDKRANWLKLTEEDKELGDKIVYFDFKSLYPSVQKCEVHDTHFPTGRGQWLSRDEWGPTSNENLISLMGEKTGFIDISFKILKYVTHPTLHRVGSHKDSDDSTSKLLFELEGNEPKEIEGRLTGEVYAWPEILEAIRCGEIEVTHLHQAYLFDKTTDVFAEYVDFFFKQKEIAEIENNEGARSMSKLLLNSLWGKLGQRSYSTNEWITDNTERLDYLYEKFENETFQMENYFVKEDGKVHFKYRIPDDFQNRADTAPHIAAFVSMWGRVILHKKLLSEHGMRALYCDTDSAIVYLRGGIDEMKYTGNGLGDLTDEVKKLAPKEYIDPYISEIVLLAPKTYAMEIKDSLTDATYYKVVSKGFEPSFQNQKCISFEAYKQLIFTKYGLNSFMNGKRSINEEEYNIKKRYLIHTEKGLQFRASVHRNELVPRESYTIKTLKGDYNKGKVHPNDPRFIVPYSTEFSPPEGSFLTNRSKHYE